MHVALVIVTSTKTVIKMVYFGTRSCTKNHRQISMVRGCSILPHNLLLEAVARYISESKLPVVVPVPVDRRFCIAFDEAFQYQLDSFDEFIDTRRLFQLHTGALINPCTPPPPVASTPYQFETV